VTVVRAGFDSGALLRLRAAFQRLIDARRIPGAVLLLAHGDAPPHVESLGWRDAERGLPMRADAIFRIHSMSKPIVSVAAMLLVERGLLRLADPVGRYLPGFADLRVAGAGAAAEPAMTVYDLLRHSAGLTYDWLPAHPVRALYAQAQLGDRARSNAEQCDAIAGLPLMHAPGTVWEYSRATDVLGRLLEVVGSQSLGALLAETVLAPLGMVDTGFAVAPGQHDRIAEPFALDPDSGAATATFDPRLPARLESGGAGLLSTASDYARFARCLLGGGTLDGVRLLGRKTVAWMAADHLGALTHDASVLPRGYGFGLGFAVRTSAGAAGDPASVGSYGWSGAAGSIFVVDPAERLCAVLMVQAPGQAAELWDLFRTLVYAALD
jgi:CubicO group peptidase (beta-lactamase class C family)